MKEGHFTLLDEAYGRLMERVTGVFTANEIPYVVVGGSGIQLAITSALTQNGKVSTAQKKYELRGLLRPTDDIDMAVKAERLEVGNALQELTASDPTLDVSLPYDRTPTVNITCKEGVPRRIHLNIQTDQAEFKGLTAWYDEIIAGGRPLTISYNNHPGFQVVVAEPEFLIASKLTRARPKDIVDIFNLLNVLNKNQVHRDRIKDILNRCDKMGCMVTLDAILADLQN
ncbi:MAG: hypothetical protein Q8L34_03485 [Candidatus Woesearchaeota archaeon]|nr:hypothetical protein [Candidatus Woesearchaeota archaeon]